MRRHMTMEQLARDVLADARATALEKTASTTKAPVLQTEIGQLLTKVAAEIRSAEYSDLTYADIALAAEVRRGRY